MAATELQQLPPVQGPAPRCTSCAPSMYGGGRCALAADHDGRHSHPAPRGCGTIPTTWWDPRTHPYRVSWNRRTNAPGMYGWDLRGEVYQTEERALEVLRRPFGAGVVSAEVERAEIREGATWQDGGRWVRLWSRKRKAEVVRARGRS